MLFMRRKTTTDQAFRANHRLLVIVELVNILVHQKCAAEAVRGVAHSFPCISRWPMVRTIRS